MTSLRTTIATAFVDMGVAVEADAVAELMDFIESQNDDLETLTRIRDAVEAGNMQWLTADKAREIVASLQGLSEETAPIQILDAFQLPQMCYDPIRKTFYQSHEPRTLQGSAQDKINVRVQRFHLVRQRVLRNPTFTRPAFGGLGTTAREYCQLSEIRALRGLFGVPAYSMGYITQMGDGRYYLEDLSDCVPLDISEADTTPGFFTENCIVIAEGEFQHSGVFRVRALVFPPLEAKAESEAAVKGLNFFGGKPVLEEEESEADAASQQDRIVFAANLWLDQPQTLARLRTLLSGFEEMDQVPKMFVLMGDFQSYSCNTASVDHVAIRDNFRQLASLIAKYHRLRKESTWVFMPGPRDPGLGGILPRPPLAEIFQNEIRGHLPEAVFASNPCRIRYHNLQIVVFRADLEARMRKLCLLPPAGDGQAETMFENMAATLLQQAHLCPLPMSVQPVFWCHDHALRLYPLPDVCVIADPCRAADFTYEGCTCISPGSFVDGSFAALVTSTREVEPCVVPLDDA